MLVHPARAHSSHLAFVCSFVTGSLVLDSVAYYYYLHTYIHTGMGCDQISQCRAPR